MNHPKHNSMLIKKEIVQSVLEYVENKMLIYVLPKDLLIVHDWEIVKVIEEPVVGNGQKYWLCPLVWFNVEEFPFVVMSG